MVRFTIPVASAAELQTHYEAAVPELPGAAVQQLVARGAPWSEMLELIDASAPHGFLIYFRNDVRPVMSLAGDKVACVSYLMGNHTIAERMFRHDPRAILYAPLHTVIWEDVAGDAWFTLDKPSAQFASLEIPEIREVGFELDRKVASPLDHLGVPVPVPLTVTLEVNSANHEPEVCRRCPRPQWPRSTSMLKRKCSAPPTALATPTAPRAVPMRHR